MKIGFPIGFPIGSPAADIPPGEFPREVRPTVDFPRPETSVEVQEFSPVRQLLRAPVRCSAFCVKFATIGLTRPRRERHARAMHPGQSASETSEIGALLDRYLLTLDDEELDDEWARSLFADEACVEFPMSRHEGIDGLAEYHRLALAAFESTQHLNSPAVVDLSGDDRATLRANLIATHVHLPGAAEPIFATGTLATGEARRTPDGWRLTLLSFRLLWKTGTPPGPARDDAVRQGADANRGEG
ncbi:hypothetical protein P3T37_002042 [Kitasatospora sp. MAA4]|uniref:nuclear transport factor 2 family protein n=1 Tax=Kitasatospora sp. MAA4 TaxID=3035093 RepID=UPI002476DCE6|nr:nuclear transport factor 2 family protein [Kitasatospora sp. MAA4]MDH6132656.1 hypothetical protein [Kitasatospora sp. MAA4]